MVSLGVFLVAVLTDWYDGWHARKFGQVTTTGIFLDPLADKVLTSFAFILFYILGIMPLWMVIVIVARDIFITLLRSYHEYSGYTMGTSYIAKVKTFVQMVYIFAVLGGLMLMNMNVSLQATTSINKFLYSDTNYYIMIFVTALTLYTGVQYLFQKKVIPHSAGKEHKI